MEEKQPKKVVNKNGAVKGTNALGGGRKKGTPNQKKVLEEKIANIIDKNFEKIFKAALESDELTAKEKAVMIKDYMPYAAAKKSEKKDEIPDHLKFVKIVIKGYTPDQDPFKDDDKNE